MNHPRKLIRVAAVAALIGTAPAYATAAGVAVFRTRKIPMRQRELPVIAVYTDEETVEAESHQTAPLELKREVDLIVECYVAVTDDMDDELDSMARQVEIAVQRDTTLAGTASYCRLYHTEVFPAQRGDQEIGVVRLAFRTMYYDPMTDALSALDVFQTADIKHNLGGAQQPAEVTEDIVTLPTT